MLAWTGILFFIATTAIRVASRPAGFLFAKSARTHDESTLPPVPFNAEPGGFHTRGRRNTFPCRSPTCSYWQDWRNAFDPDAAEIRGPAERLVKEAFRAVAGEFATHQRLERVREILLRALRELEGLSRG